ncbi:DUF4177 domain-containing protein [Tabrizicola oligotrophica]|uniref:DUF4177 domain-containing protein n=1 Tax=Tabrizicola oligotrophica TaxID=2710650 RepID=A0A6M0QX81_9RHOB|nr:DUF4177 domain-containing protein [Tabrizicola oligotrophica]NEY91303.1 DUF4177 domain-containing protein [Tabrizicola oligotrophica]
MPRYEFKVIPAPRRGEKARGVKTTEDRFALALTALMNEMGAQGWDYIRADTLPVDERSGLTGTKTSYQNLLVFRRVLEAEVPRPADPRPETGQDAAFVATRRLGPAEVSPGAAPPVGPASPDMAAE